MFFNKGPEGILWEYTDKENRVKQYLPVPDGKEMEDYRATLTPNYGIPAPTLSMDDINKGLKTDFDLWVEQETKQKLLDKGARIPFPTLFLTVEEQTEISSLNSDLKTYVNQMEAKFITGAEPLTGWDNYVATVKKWAESVWLKSIRLPMIAGNPTNQVYAHQFAVKMRYKH